MKTHNTLFILSALAMTLAGTIANAKVSEFHTMIVESQAAKRELSQKLKQTIDAPQILPAPAAEKVVLQETIAPENVVSPSTFPKAAQSRLKSLDSETMKRVSQELQDSN